jgi:hypothetical protein
VAIAVGFFGLIALVTASPKYTPAQEVVMLLQTAHLRIVPDREASRSTGDPDEDKQDEMIKRSAATPHRRMASADAIRSLIGRPPIIPEGPRATSGRDFRQYSRRQFLS